MKCILYSVLNGYIFPHDVIFWVIIGIMKLLSCSSTCKSLSVECICIYIHIAYESSVFSCVLRLAEFNFGVYMCRYQLGAKQNEGEQSLELKRKKIKEVSFQRPGQCNAKGNKEEAVGIWVLKMAPCASQNAKGSEKTTPTSRLTPRAHYGVQFQNLSYFARDKVFRLYMLLTCTKGF